MTIPIFTDGWFPDGDEENPIFTDGWLTSESLSASDTPTEQDYQDYSSLPDLNFFQEETTQYDCESNLFSLLSTESINMHGVPMIYYVVSFDTNYDKLLGEDNNRTVSRNFRIMAHYELPNEDEIWNSWGIEGIDNFHLEIAMKHFEVASTFNPNGTTQSYSPYTPKQGDYLKARYNDYFYEIVTVKQQKGQFLQRQHLWDLIVKPIRDENISLSATLPMNDKMKDVQAILDIFDTKDTIEAEKPDKLFDNTGNEEQDSLFGNW